jgi:hypothetical protein
MVKLLGASLGLVLMAGMVSFAPATMSAQSNNGNQRGLINVNASDIVASIPVSVALPIGIAADLCGVNAAVLGSAQQDGSPISCTANGSPSAASIAQALSTGSGGPGNNNGRQSGLVNVNISNIVANIPVSAAVPVGIAANACGINAAALLAAAAQQGSTYSCTATSMPTGLAQALAGA